MLELEPGLNSLEESVKKGELASIEGMINSILMGVYFELVVNEYSAFPIFKDLLVQGCKDSFPDRLVNGLTGILNAAKFSLEGYPDAKAIKRVLNRGLRIITATFAELRRRLSLRIQDKESLIWGRTVGAGDFKLVMDSLTAQKELPPDSRLWLRRDLLLRIIKDTTGLRDDDSPENPSWNY